MSNHNLLTYEADSGTEVDVQSETMPENFYDGVVGEDGIVRQERNGAAFNADSYTVIGEK